MKVNKEQIDIIISLIEEGESIKNSAIEGKKKYLFNVYNILSSILRNNNDSDSALPEQTCIPKYTVSESGVDVDPNYPETYIDTAIKVLKEIKDNYYDKSQLDELKKQTFYARMNFISTLISTFLNPI